MPTPFPALDEYLSEGGQNDAEKGGHRKAS
jgi:hypothetical protein